VPILVINGGADRPYKKVVAAVDPVHAHAKPADLDQAIVAMATLASERSQASLSLVHCYVPLSRYGAGAEGPDRVPLNDAEQALEQSRQQALSRLAAKAGLDAGATRLIEGDPVKDLEHLVVDDDVDLIVMGALSRGKLADFVIGSTAERLLHRSGCDILLVKPAGASS
jgi:universal stress protein E